jgi:hypothetical protein
MLPHSDQKPCHLPIKVTTDCAFLLHNSVAERRPELRLRRDDFEAPPMKLKQQSQHTPTPVGSAPSERAAAPSAADQPRPVNEGVAQPTPSFAFAGTGVTFNQSCKQDVPRSCGIKGSGGAPGGQRTKSRRSAAQQVVHITRMMAYGPWAARPRETAEIGRNAQYG